MQHPLPKLVTFDGGARSGKGTVVSRVKDYVRDVLHQKVMLIDAGQVFRVLVVAMTRAGVNVDEPAKIDTYLRDSTHMTQAVQLVKAVYHMPKDEREALLYTNEVGVNSAKVAARPDSQMCKDRLLQKWLQDARHEGFETVLLDGRALEEVGEALSTKGLCRYVLGFFFVCDPVVSAQRTLGWMPVPYHELREDQRTLVDELVQQIIERNQADHDRIVQPVHEPDNALTYDMLHIPALLPPRQPRPMAIIDRSIEVPFDTMALPIARLVEQYVS